MTVIRYEIQAIPAANQFGWPVSLVKYVNDELIEGFTLHSCESRESQLEYAWELGRIAGQPVKVD